jgi:hypothetical protein
MLDVVIGLPQVIEIFLVTDISTQCALDDRDRDHLIAVSGGGNGKMFKEGHDAPR